jgi:hypothetical protein
MGNKNNLIGQVTQLLSTKNLALLHRGDRFVILSAGLVVVAALGAVAALRNFPSGATILAITAMLIVAGLVALVQYRAVSMEDVEADLMKQAAAATAVNGEWWELVYAKDHPGLSYVSIAISEVAEQHAMHGITYGSDGHREARWSSDAIAIRTSTPIELYYVWRGTTIGPKDAKIVSGMGRFRFDSVGREKKPLQAEGSFTRGSPTELNFGTPRNVELIRFTEDESKKLKDSRFDPLVINTLAVEAFDRFKLERKRSFSEKDL